MVPERYHGGRSPAMYEWSSATHVGLVRANNEDCSDTLPGLGLFVVADGLGGAACGERASSLTVSTVVDAAREAGDRLTVDIICEAVELANRRIWHETASDLALVGMGTTITAALLHDDRVEIVNAGDSRAYRYRNGTLERLTTDHTWIRDLAEASGRSEDDFRDHRLRHMLTKAVGAESRVDPDTVSSDFEPGDLLLLSSDGLHGFVAPETIAEVLGADGRLEEKTNRLIQETLALGAPDNVTVLLVGHEAAS